MSKKVQKQVGGRSLPFHALVALIAVFSGYAIVSFVFATNDYVDYMQANVMGVDEVNGNGEEEDLDVTGVVETVKTEDITNPFLDLADNHPNRDAILFLYHEGIVKGNDYGNFNPDAKVTRAEAVKMVLDAAKTDLVAYEPLENCFKDVRTVELDWFAVHVCAGKAAGFFSGNADGSFYPNAEVSKAELLKIVLLVFGMDVKDNSKVVSSPYMDVALDAWYLGVADAAGDYGLVRPSDTFDAGRLLSRGDVAQVIVNAMRNQ